MLQTKLVYSEIWHNLPLRAQATACLLLSIPLMGLTVIGLGILGVHQFQFLAIPAAALELFALVCVLQAAHQRICELKSATDRVCEGESLPGMPPHSWELNAISRNLESVAATLQQLQRETAESREQATRLFEDTPAAYLETDAQGAVKRANRGACRLLGRSAEEVCHMHVWEVFGAAEGPTSQKQLLEKADRTDASEFDKEYVRPDGTELMVGVQESLLLDLRGSLTGIRYFLNDVTPRVRAAEMAARCEEQLRLKDDQLAKALADTSEARRAKSQLLSNVSDDLRVPLNTIVGLAELMLDRKIGVKAAERRECLGDILSSARELTGVVDHLLDAGEVGSVNQPLLRHGTVGPETLVHDARYLMQALSTEGHGARVQADLDPEVQYVTVDQEALRQLLISHLSYAGKMVSPDGQVVVRTTAEGSSGYRLDTPPGRGTVLQEVLHPVNEFARHKGDGVFLDALQGLAKVLGEISGAEITVGARLCQESASSGKRDGRSRLKSVAGPGRKRLA